MEQPEPQLTAESECGTTQEVSDTHHDRIIPDDLFTEAPFCSQNEPAHDDDWLGGRGVAEAGRTALDGIGATHGSEAHQALRKEEGFAERSGGGATNQPIAAHRVAAAGETPLRVALADVTEEPSAEVMVPCHCQ